MSSEACFRLLLTGHPLPAWIYDLETLRFLEVSDAAVEQYQYGRDEFLQMTLPEIHLEGERLPELERGQSHSGRYQHRRKDGALLDVEVTTHGLEGDGRPAALAIAHDITKLKKVEQTLRQSETRYRSLVESTGAGVWQMRPEGKTIYINPAMCRLLGVDSPEEVIGKSFHPFFTAESAERIEAEAARRVAGEMSSYKAELVRVDGERRRVQIYGAPIFTAGGKLHSRIGTVIDISELERVDELRRHLASIVEASEDAIIGVDLDDRIVSWNRGAEKIYGYKAEEVAGRSLTILVPTERKHEFKEISDKVRSGEGVTHFETRRMRRDGSEIDVSLTVSPIKDGDGRVTGASVVARDISVQKRLEAERQRLLERERKLNEELEERVQRRTRQLETANQELEAFAYSVSHDLRAPLRSIDGFSQALLEDYPERLDETGQHYLQRIQAGAQRMGQLIDELLRLSRISRSELQCETVDLSAMAAEIVATLRRSDPARKVEFIITRELTAEGDRHLLHVVLENLLENASKFTSRETTARIEFGCEENGEGGAIFFVRDNGVGFDMTYVDKIFGAFQRLHGQETFPGTGIGLATVQRIIHRHGGEIWAEGATGEGATFYFTLS